MSRERKRERERERERGREGGREHVCVCGHERERERERDGSTHAIKQGAERSRENEQMTKQTILLTCNIVLVMLVFLFVHGVQ